MVFAARGFSATSVQAIADVTGYSKTGLLSRYGSKDLLFSTVTARSKDLTAEVLQQVEDSSWGDARDDLAVTVFTDMALANPGSMALLLAALTSTDDELRSAISPIVSMIWQIFDPPTVDVNTVEMAALHPDVFARRLRITAAIGVIATIVTATRAANFIPQLQPLIVSAARNALESSHTHERIAPV